MIDTTHETTGAVARALGLREPQLQAVLRRRPDLAPTPTRGKRLWSPADVQRLRAHLGTTTPLIR
jgi:hypothetical protein